jgi:acylphosphatase
MKTLRLQILGRVQGVWFRESMRREAERLGVAGWVRNAPDGSVEAVVQGPDEAVDALIAWAHDGPPMGAHQRERDRGALPRVREADRLSCTADPLSLLAWRFQRVSIQRPGIPSGKRRSIQSGRSEHREAIRNARRSKDPASSSASLAMTNCSQLP